MKSNISCWGAQPPHQQTCSNAVTTSPESHPTSRGSETLEGATTILYLWLAMPSWCRVPMPGARACQQQSAVKPLPGGSVGHHRLCRGQHRAQGSQSLHWTADSYQQPPSADAGQLVHSLRNFKTVRTSSAHPRSLFCTSPCSCLLLPFPSCWLTDRDTYQDDHVPELLQQAHLPVACFELFIFWH